MRFKMKPDPSFGDTRNVRAFAWLPVCIGNNVVWLEGYWKRQLFIAGGYDDVSRWATVGYSLKEDYDLKGTTDE